MISIPISFLLTTVFAALLISVPFWKPIPVVSRACFSVLLGLLALESGLVGLRFAFDIFDLLLLQRALPVWIAPAAYASFLALTCAPVALVRPVMWQGGFAVLATGVILAPIPVPGLIDGVIAISYLCYCVLLLALWRRGPDALSQVPVRLTPLLHPLLLAVLLLMAATLVVDTIIAVLFSIRDVDAATDMISFASLGVLLGIMALALWFAIGRRQAADQKPAAPDPARSTDIVDAARQLLVAQELYRDPGLTLTRLARRTGVPDRDLSQAVNQIAGVSVSQFVNQIRLEEAAHLLRQSDAPVVQILEQAGFLTRSNFYRAFQNHFGMSPGAYRSMNAAGVKD